MGEHPDAVSSPECQCGDRNGREYIVGVRNRLAGRTGFSRQRWCFTLPTGATAPLLPPCGRLGGLRRGDR
jgi:hypothetical protein